MMRGLKRKSLKPTISEARKQHHALRKLRRESTGASLRLPGRKRSRNYGMAKLKRRG